MIIARTILLLLFIAWFSSPKEARPVSYLPYSPLKKYLKPANWKGTPVDRTGRFVNYEHPFYQNYLRIIFWLPGHLASILKNRKLRFPVDYRSCAELLRFDETLVWLGHSSFFLKVDGVAILIDPHFNDVFLYKRHTDNPVAPGSFINIDYIFLSHDHADHCDKRTIQLLLQNNPKVKVLAGVNMDSLVKSFYADQINVITAQWYERFDIESSLEIYFVPGRHYSKRIFKKFNSTLWGGFVIKYSRTDGTKNTIYYGGDSGYGNHFKDIKELFHPRLAILPIGAYQPQWFMHPNHTSPEEALQAFRDCGASFFIPMHYSTFNLANESMTAPIKTLLQHAGSAKVIYLKVGEIYFVR